MAIDTYPSNAELIAAAHQLGYIHGQCLDCTFGLGTFWKVYEPPNLIACDLNAAKSPIGRSVDFRHMPWDDQTFSTVVIDAPYRLAGTADRGAYDERFGMDESMRWQDRMQLIRDGITECLRVTVLGGHVLCKAQDQVCSGAKRFQTIDFTNHAVAGGAELVDMLHMTYAPRPQPPGRKQCHSRGNYSTLMIFKKVTRLAN